MEDLTTGSISRHLLKTTSFMLVTMVFQTLYFLVDLYWVGRLGREAIAGVGIAGNLTFIVLAITQMLAVGTTTLISHATGRKEREQAQQVLTQSLLLAAFIGGVFHIAVTVLRESYVTALSPDPVSAEAASSYLSWFIPAMALQFPMVVMAAALRGTGNFKPGMVVQTATVIINIVLAPVLMFGWAGTEPMGVAGAGLASFIAIIVGTIWLAYYFFDTASYLKLHPQLHAERQHVGAGVEDRIARRRRIRVHRRVFVRGLHREPAVRGSRTGRVWHRPADHSSRVHADRGARIRCGAGRGTEFRRAQGGARARDLQARRSHGGEHHGPFHDPLHFRRRGDDSILLVRSSRRRSRRASIYGSSRGALPPEVSCS